MNFREFESLYSQDYIENKFEDALEKINNVKNMLDEKDYTENLFIILNDKALILSLTKRYEEAFLCFEELVRKGYACHPKRIKRLFSENDEKVVKLLEENKVLLQKVKQESKLEYKVFLPDGYKEGVEYPLFINLHGDGIDGNIKDSIHYWKPDPLLKKGYIVLYPQSSQTYCYGGHGWLIDKELSRKEIKTCYDEVISKYRIDINNVIVAGFSGGAMAAIDFSMFNIFPIKGFIGLCPGENTKTFSNTQITAATKKGIKGVIMEGEDDLVLPIKKLVDDFKEIGFKHEYYINEGVAHWYPKDLVEKTQQAIDFINLK